VALAYSSRQLLVAIFVQHLPFTKRAPHIPCREHVCNGQVVAEYRILRLGLIVRITQRQRIACN